MADAFQLKAILSAVDKMSPVLRNVATTAKTTRKYLSDVASSASNLSSKVGLPLTALSGVIGGFSLVAIKNAVTAFGDMGEAIHKGSIRAGMSVEEYQRMKYVAEQAGVGVEMLEGSMGKLNRIMGDVGGGKNKDAAALFKRLGVNIRDNEGHIKAGIDILPQLADAFKRNKDPAVQARMGVALFGKSWQEIAPMLMEGAEGIAGSLERMGRFKGVMGADDIEGARQFAKSLRDLDFVAKGFQMTIAKQLAPVLKPLIDDFASWAAANKKVIAASVAQAAKDLGAWIKSIDWKGVAKGVQELAQSLGRFVDFVGGAKNALIGLVVFMNLPAIGAFFGLLGAVGRLIWGLGVMTFSAIPQAITGIGGLGAAMTQASNKAVGLMGILGKLGGVAGAAFTGWEMGTLINDYVINPSVKALTGDKNQTLGGWIYDKTHPDQASAPRPSLVGSRATGRVEGEVNININGLPPGSRVEQTSGGTMPMNLDAGFSSYALGMP